LYRANHFGQSIGAALEALARERAPVERSAASMMAVACAQQSDPKRSGVSAR